MSKPFEGRRVWIVDDHVTVAGLVVKLLEYAGCTAKAFTRATDALEAARENPHDVDLIITDYRMPDLTGIQLCRSLHALRQDLLLVLCTGEGDPPPEEELGDVGVVEVLRKPFQRDELNAMLDRVLP